MNGVTMNIINKDKFSENILSFRYLLDLDRKTITAYNVLSYMIKAKTELFEDKNTISKILNKNYGTRFSLGLSSYGKILSMQFRIRYIRADWIENESYVDNIITIMDQFLFHAILTQETLEEAKYLLKNRLTMQNDDPAYISIKNAFEMLGQEYPVSIPLQGILKEVDSISLQDVNELYLNLKEMKPYVYACGNIEDKIQMYLKKVANTNDLKSNYMIFKPSSYETKVIEKDIEQTCITKVYATNIDPQDDQFYSLMLMNSILGQSPINLLFEEIREKHSFCYSIGSNVIRFDGILYIYVGCKKEYIDDILSLIDIQVQKIIDQDYNDELMEIAKKDWKDALIAGMDNQMTYIEREFLSQITHKRQTIEQRMEKIDSLTKDDVSQVAKQLKEVSLSIVKEVE